MCLCKFIFYIFLYSYVCVYIHIGLTRGGRTRCSCCHARSTKCEVDAMGVIAISRGHFERCCSNKKFSHTILTLVSSRFEPGGRRCSVRSHTARRPRVNPPPVFSLFSSSLKCPLQQETVLLTLHVL